MSQSKQELRRIKHNIISMGNPVRGAIAFFNSESTDTIQRYGDVLSREDFFRRAIVGRCCPATIGDMVRCGNMPRFFDLKKTLGWCTLAICAESKRINDFLELRNQFEYAFLLGQYEQCFELLECSRKEFGRSFWDIKNQISVLNERDGLDTQRKYADSILAEMVKGSVDAYQVYCYSRQCERNISVGAFFNMLERDYARFIKDGVTELKCKYAYFKASGNFLSIDENRWLVDETVIDAFLYVDDKYDLIDRYLSLCDIVTNVFMHGSEKLRELFIPYIEKISAVIPDPFFKNIVFQWKNHYSYFYSSGNDRICQAFDLYSVGQYEACMKLTRELLLENIVNFPLVELFAKCCMFLSEYVPITSERSPINTIVRKSSQLFSRTGDARDIQTDLMKILYLHPYAIWSQELLLVIAKFNSRLMILEECNTINYYAAITTPDRIFNFDVDFLPDFLGMATETYRNSASTRLAVAMRTKEANLLEGLGLDETRKKKYKAKLLSETNPIEALEVLNQLREERDVEGAIKLEVDALRVRSYLQMDNLLRAIEIFVPAFCENSNFIYMGAVDRIFEEIKTGNQDVSNSILTPIICSLYFNYYPDHDDMDDIVLSACYEEYLDACGVSKPSELLLNPPTEINANILNRFLAEVCVPNVMARSLAFESEDDILRERNIICDILADRDAENSEKYVEEIRRHTNTLLVRLAKREIDNGKVYIDIEAIRTLLFQEVCESFERYLEYRKSNLEEYVFAIVNDPSEPSADPIYLYQRVKKTGMLEEIIKKTRDIFTADNKYGLDGTLSVRIRHGTLESQLRSCFEKHNLITTKAVDGSYNPNRHWHTGRWMKTEVEKSIDEIFASFSSEIDAQIAYIKNELIQIHTENKNPDGVFDFTIDENLISRIDADMYNITSYHMFESYIIDMMVDITNICLEKMRDLLDRDINDSFQRMLHDLETKLQKYQTAVNFQGLRDHIAKARTDISAELKNIAEWFRRTQSDDFRDFDFLLAAQLSYQTFQHSHPSYALRCDYDDIDTSIELEGRTLRSVVDIFIILLDNVMKHSGITSGISARISAKREGNVVALSVTNPVKPGCVSAAHLKEITEQLGTWENRDFTRREGGSGLHKVKKILSVDLKCDNKIKLSCIDDTFMVDIRAELGGVMR